LAAIRELNKSNSEENSFKGLSVIRNRLLYLANACRGERRGAVRATLIVFDTPAFQDNAGLLQIADEFAMNASTPQSGQQTKTTTLTNP
jgi:hypothetical protein